MKIKLIDFVKKDTKIVVFQEPLPKYIGRENNVIRHKGSWKSIPGDQDLYCVKSDYAMGHF